MTEDVPLFDIRPPRPPDTRSGRDEDVHVLLPCMAYACEETILTRRGSWTTAHKWDQVTCPDCRAIGQAELVYESARQQGPEALERWAEAHPEGVAS